MIRSASWWRRRSFFFAWHDLVDPLLSNEVRASTAAWRRSAVTFVVSGLAWIKTQLATRRNTFHIQNFFFGIDPTDVEINQQFFLQSFPLDQTPSVGTSAYDLFSSRPKRSGISLTVWSDQDHKGMYTFQYIADETHQYWNTFLIFVLQLSQFAQGLLQSKNCRIEWLDVM